MTFKLNNNTVGRRRYGSTTSFSVSSGGPVGEPAWTNTGAGGAFKFYGNTNSYVRYENNGQFNLSGGDFTIEWWQYETDSNGAPRPWAFGAWPNTELGISFEGDYAYYWGHGGIVDSWILQKAVKNKRNHFALVRYIGIVTLYQNGNFVGTVFDSGNYNLTSDLTIGYEGGEYDSQCFAGTITNFNILNYAKYTNNFVPTTTALSIDPQARLFVPAGNSDHWLEPYGDYVGSAQAGTNTDWVQVSPFAYPAPNPLVTFPYPPVASSQTSYQFPETHWTSYGQMASEGVAAGLVAYTYRPGVEGYMCASSDFAPFSVQSNDGYVNDFYCAAGGNLITTTTYTCPDGGYYNSVTGMCQEFQPTAEVTGGVLSSDNQYYYRTFTETGTLSVSNMALTNAEVLCIAGGGYPGAGIYQWWNGVWAGGGGGGAGGAILASNQTLDVGNYTIEVGAAGNNSSIKNGPLELWTAIAGGGGGSTNNDGWGPGGNGGSGGGGDYYGTGGSGTSGQGYNGGNGATYNGGGGGGAAGAGAHANQGGQGGTGIFLPDWATATGTGVDGGYYAGGGGGRYHTPGLGAQTSAANTGAGGTSALANPSSGLVIVRWAK